MRAIAEEAFEMVRQYKGSHSGEHGDGVVRSEFHRTMFGDRKVSNFEEVKDIFDPKGILNPGKIVHPPKFDDRSLFRFKPDYEPMKLHSGLDWSEWGSLSSAVEMCNNNGACRKFDAGVMCPSFRDPRRKTPCAWSSKHAPPRSLRTARPRRVYFRRDAGNHGTMRWLQRMQTGMSNWRRYGTDENGVPLSLRSPQRPKTKRSSHCLPAAICRSRTKFCIPLEFTRCHSGNG